MFIPWWWQADDAMMFKLIVHPQKEHQGYGERILKKLCHIAALQGCATLGVDVFDLYPRHIL